MTALPAIGRKCLGVNLSDIAAMAGRPVAAVVSVALPRARAAEIAMGLHAGIEALAREFDVALAGGDTNAWDGPLVVSVTVLGEATGRGPVRRSGAVVGDVVLVTGPLGGSLLGRHLDPRPRVREALALHAVGRAPCDDRPLRRARERSGPYPGRERRARCRARCGGDPDPS